MSTDEQFARRLRFEADDVPAIPVDAQRILQTGRRRRQLRPVIGGAAGALGIAVAIAAFSALQPSPSAIAPAGAGDSATAPEQAVVDGIAAQEAQARNDTLDAELGLQVERARLTFVLQTTEDGGYFVQYREPNTLTVVSTECMAAAGYNSTRAADGTSPAALPLSEKVAYNEAYSVCAEAHRVQDGKTLVVGTP